MPESQRLSEAPPQLRLLRGADADGSVNRLEGVDAVRRFRERADARNTRERLDLLGTSTDALPTGRGRDQAALGRGVRLRTVCPADSLEDRRASAYVRWLAAEGALIRTAPCLPVPLTIYDRSTALLAVDPADPARAALVVTGGSLLTALVGLFEMHWKTAAELPSLGRRRPSGKELAPVQLELLKLLAAGGKDESAARELGLSVRTVRRMVSDLSERLGARSRFELAVAAARADLV